MANLRRRSARLNKTDTNQSSPRKTLIHNAGLGSLAERDETPAAVEESVDEAIATPTTSRTVSRLSQLSALKTPQTAPRTEQVEMDPKTAHRSTAKAPDSGLKLGFSDINTDKRFDTPSKSATRQSISSSSTFEFKFSADAHLSRDAQKLMDNVREDAARIKAQMIAEKAAQEQKDEDAEKMFGAGRKIAQPKSKAGRFSEVHMAQFKKMDSIANHASAFRARPGFAAPTVQSLKRSPSKAELDAIERPASANKSTVDQPRRITPPVLGRPNSVSPFKSIPVAQSRNTQGPTKRARQSEHQDVSDSRPAANLAMPKSSTLYSPTKSSAARISKGVVSPPKPSMIPRSSSTRSVRSQPAVGSTSNAAQSSTTTLESASLLPIPTEAEQPLYPSLPSSPSKDQLADAKSNFTSKLPTLSGLRSILRSNRRSTVIAERPGTPKRPNTAGTTSESPKKVDFTPSVKSRYAVKLAVDSPSPAKIRRDTPYKSSEPVIPYDSSAYIIPEDEGHEWEDDDSEVIYPTLPSAETVGPIAQTFQTKASEHNRRESKDFKSIFTTLHPARSTAPRTLTSINTNVNKTNPEVHTTRVMRSPSHASVRASPSTIRRVRTSSNTLVQPFEDKIGTVPHGLPGKKRRHESIQDNDKHGSDEDAKENRRISEMPNVPGGWSEETDEVDNESSMRAGKRVRRSSTKVYPGSQKSPVKKPNAAREMAAKNAKERKGRGVLSLSRLNMLSRPKSRG